MIVSLAQIETLLFIIARVAGVFIQAPLLSTRSFPTAAKTALVVWLALVIWFVTPVAANPPGNLIGFIFVLAAETAIGFLIGFICNVIFTAIQSAGEIIDLQMGLSVAQALDPTFGAVISIIGRLMFFTSLVIFLIFNGHHMLLSALHQSFRVIPAGQLPNFASAGLVQQLMGVTANLWLIAIKISVPIVLLIFIADFSFGIVSRVAPQVNVFMLGFQVKPVLGLFAITLILPFLIKYLGQLIGLMGQEVSRLLIFIH